MNDSFIQLQKLSHYSGTVWTVAMLALALLFPVPGGWTIDDGVKLIAATQGKGVWAEFLADGPVRSQLSVPAAFPPLHPPFAVRTEGGVAFGFAPLTRAYFALLGGNALALRLSLVAGALLLWLLLERKGLRFAFLLLPLTFYGFAPWEHVLSWMMMWPMIWMALGQESVSRARAIAIGISAAIAILLRPETAVMTAAMAGYLICRKRFVPAGLVTATAALVLAGFAALHRATGHESLLAQVQLNVSNAVFDGDWLTERTRAVAELLFRMDRNVWVAILLINIFWLGYATLKRGDTQKKRHYQIAGVILLVLWCGIYQYRLWSHPLPPLALLGANSLLVAAPWVIVLLRPPYRGRPGLLLAAICIAVVLAVLPVWEGVHWGPRLLLFVVPLLVIDLYQTKRGEGLTFAVLLAMTLIQTASSGVLAYARNRELADRHERLEKKVGDVVICPTMSQCVDLAPLWEDREFFTAVNERELKQLLIEFRRINVDTCWLHLEAHDPMYVKTFPDARPVRPYRMTVVQAGSIYKTQWRVYELAMNAQDTLWAAILQAEAGTLLSEDNAERALALQEEAVDLVSRSAQAHHNLALVLMRLGRTNEARAEAARALEIDPELREAQNLWADLSRNGATRSGEGRREVPDQARGTD